MYGCIFFAGDNKSEKEHLNQWWGDIGADIFSVCVLLFRLLSLIHCFTEAGDYRLSS